MRRVLILSLLFGLTWQASRLALAQTGWSAGVAEGKITPPVGTHLVGFAARPGPSTGIHDDLFVRALVVSRNNTVIALVEADLVEVSKEAVVKIRDEVSRQTAISPEQMLISATHTHGGPELKGGYGDFFVRTAVDTVVRAWQSRQPALIGATTTTHRGWVGMNRRHLESGFSPIDKQVSILKICDVQGRLQAILYNYSCHPACLGPDNLLVTADWPCYVADKIRSKLGESVKVLYFQGTEGDVNTGYSAGLSSIGVSIPTRTYAYAQELGEILADAIVARIPDMALQSDGPLEAQHGKVNIEYYIPSTVVDADSRLEQARAALRRAREQKALQSQIDDARVAVSFAENNRQRIEDNLNAGQREYAAEIQAFRIGDAGFVSFPGEFFVEIGLAVKQRSPLHPTFLLGLANDSVGYIPTPESYPEGGYEVSVARFGPSTAGRWEEAAMRLVNQLSASTRRGGPPGSVRHRAWIAPHLETLR
jgi:hypothetical protein